MKLKKMFILFSFLFLFFSFGSSVSSNDIFIHKKQIKKEKTAIKKEIIKNETKEKENIKIKHKEERNVKVLSYDNEKEWTTYEATFYNLCCNLTKSGRKLEDGVTVAVDPRIIPLGTWIEIKYPDGRVEQRRADDTGGAIKGKILDVYVAKPTRVLLQMGRQDVKVRILKEKEGE